MAGYTSRVGDMLDVFEDASHGKYQRTVVTTSEFKLSSRSSSFRMELKNGQPVVKGNAVSCMYLFLISLLLTVMC